MAKLFEIDWIVIPVGGARKLVAAGIIFVVAAVLLLVAALLLHQPPDVEARNAIERAQDVRQRLEGETLESTWRSERREADEQLQEARAAYTGEAWEDAIRNARAARNRYELILGAANRELAGVGQVLTVEGQVDVQRAGRSRWIPSHERQPLFNGDFVRTGPDGTAEILFADGNLFRVTPNSLLEISRRAQSGDRSDVAMKVGQVSVHTSESSAVVSTEAAAAEIGRDSRVSVDVGQENRGTTIAAYSGRARVTGRSGDVRDLESRFQVRASPDGEVGEAVRIPDPPTLLDPPVGARFELNEESLIELRWRLPTGEESSRLQVSRSRLFLPGAAEIDVMREGTTKARLRPVQAGTYFWRAATVGDEGVASEWSVSKSFRIDAPRDRLGFVDETPPELDVAPLRQMGQLFMIEGVTEPGAAVTINGESVAVDGDGHFRKTVEATHAGWNEVVIRASDPAGNTTEDRRKAFVEVL